jgi:PDDEXK-like uncharacterized protein DUF3799
MNPGLYPGLPMAEYLGIPAVSASLLQVALEECPRAAWWQSWMNPKPPSFAAATAADVGTIAHAILLEGSTAGVQVIDPNDHPNEDGKGHAKGWTNKSIKAARAAAIADGKVPIFPDTMLEVQAMVAAARDYIESLKESEPMIWALFQPNGGESELTIVWKDGNSLCRIRPDRISVDRKLICDYKTGGTSAEPDAWGRTQLVRMGYYTSAAFYRRGVAKACGGKPPKYIYLVQEQEAPYLCSLVGLSPAAVELGDENIRRALALWTSCTRSGNWPGYPARVAYPDIPAYEMARWESESHEGIAYDPERIWEKPEKLGFDREREPI